MEAAVRRSSRMVGGKGEAARVKGRHGEDDMEEVNRAGVTVRRSRRKDGERTGHTWDK